MPEYSIVTLDEIDSTNSYVLEYADALADRTVVSARIQTAGRGRYNRKWTGAGGIYASFVLKPEEASNYPYANLTQYLSLAVCTVLENEYGIDAEIKWPNDILVHGAKIAGILAETAVRNGRINCIALGLGLNTNLDRETLERIDQKAVSMSVLKHKEIDSDEVLKKICSAFFENYDKFIQKGFICIKDEYVKRCRFLGKEITIREKNRQYQAQYIDDNGLLAVKDEFGAESKIITGDVLCAV